MWQNSGWQDPSQSERSEREKKGNVWVIHRTGGKRVLVLEATSNFVCTECVFMRHYLETTFLEEADVSMVSLDTKEKTVKLMKYRFVFF